MEDTAERLRRIAKEVLKELSSDLGFRINIFTPFRPDDVEQHAAGSALWHLRFWYKDSVELKADVEVREKTTDDEIKQKVRKDLEREVRRIGLGEGLDRIQSGPD